MDKIINTRLLTHPANWAVVWVVMLFAGFAWTLIHDRLNSTPPTTTA